MDHHELLTVTRRLVLACHTTQTRRATASPEWEFTVTPVLYPESKCPYCLSVIRSPGIWFLTDSNLYRLLGALFPTQSGPVKLVQPSHPHDTGGGYLCLGRNRDGIALLSSPPNLLDVPCLLYTSDAADERSSVDLGGRRIIKK